MGPGGRTGSPRSAGHVTEHDVGRLPPSSVTTGVRLLAAAVMTLRAVATPGEMDLADSGVAGRGIAALGARRTTLTRPGGSPASDTFTESHGDSGPARRA